MAHQDPYDDPRVREALQEPRYGLRVVYPQGGRHHILRWYTHQERNRLIVAKNERGVHDAFKRVLEKYGAVDVQEYIQADIVLPPAGYVQAAKRWAFRDAESDFWLTVRIAARSYRERHNALPEGLKACENYQEASPVVYDDDNDEDVPPDAVPPDAVPPDAVEDDPGMAEYRAERRARHEECIHCREGFVPSEGTFEKAYLDRRALYESVADPMWKRARSGHPCRASSGDESKPYYVVPESFGSTSESLTRNVLESADNEYGYIQNHFFFFQNPQELDASQLVQMRDLVEHASNTARSVGEVERREARESHDKSQDTLLLTLFGGCKEHDDCRENEPLGQACLQRESPRPND